MGIPRLFGGVGGGARAEWGDRVRGSQSRRSFLITFHYCSGLLLTPAIGESSDFLKTKYKFSGLSISLKH